MTSPIETIAARVLGEHQFDMGGPGVDPSCNGFGLTRTCDWTHPWDRPLHELWSEHRAHVAAEIARAVAEDEGLVDVVVLPHEHVAGIASCEPSRCPHFSHTRAMIDALTRKEDR